MDSMLEQLHTEELFDAYDKMEQAMATYIRAVVAASGRPLVNVVMVTATEGSHIVKNAGTRIKREDAGLEP